MRHHWISVLSSLAAVPLGSLAKPLSPRWDDMLTKHFWNAVPENWESLGRPPAGTTIDLYVALKPHHGNALIDALYQVSEPTNPKYGAHLSKEQVAELVAPHPETLELVTSWLKHHSVPSSSVSMAPGGNTLIVEGVSLTQANTILGASYQLYRHVERNETIVRTVGYALPAALHGHVQTVIPTTAFVSPHTQRQTPHNHSGGTTAGLAKSASGEPVMMVSSRDNDDILTPEFLRTLYGTITYTPAATDKNNIGIVGMSSDYPNPDDLAAFMLKYRSDAVDAAYSVVLVNGGGYDPSLPGPEANVDVQYAEAIAYPTPLTFYSTGRGPAGTTDWFVSWLVYITGRPDIPKTISISYGYHERLIPQEYAKYMCDVFTMLGVIGISVLVASGNSGVGPADCTNPDGVVQFMPRFPATCPYVTAVGGTTNYGPEVAASFSAGGFSNLFERPEYQKDAVPKYFAEIGDLHQGLYNVSGRGTPDVAAQAIGFRFFNKGEEVQASGTSGSAPVVAGMISLINDYLISRGQSPLGWLNPWLYGVGIVALKDVTSGSNPGCNTDGFPATYGWDPVTGLGTPDLGALFYNPTNPPK